MIRANPGLRTLWYMGVKTRIIPGFIAGAIGELLSEGGALLDLCCGTAVVARSVAHRYPVLANDVQRFSAVIARAHLEGDRSWRRALESLDPEADLERVFHNNLRQLSRLLPEALAREEELLLAATKEKSVGGRGSAARQYREFVEETPEMGDPGNSRSGGAGSSYETLESLSPGMLRERRRDPGVLPCALITLYYANVYFGVRQAVVLDSLRAAIAQIPATDAHRERKRDLYLAALLHAASVSTSGTSHFAQPRSVRKDSELLAVIRRRRADIELEFHRALEAIRREWGQRPARHPHRVFQMEADALLAPGGPLREENVGLVYLDPPYTADNYSRFYHVLETLVEYDYPQLQRRGGKITVGRYPLCQNRYQSEFCKKERVEGAFRRVIEGARRHSARLLVSYSADSGLLLKCWAAEGSKDPVARFRALFREFFPRVEIRERALMHSGQGDSNRSARELLVLCKD